MLQECPWGRKPVERKARQAAVDSTSTGLGESGSEVSRMPRLPTFLILSPDPRIITHKEARNRAYAPWRLKP